MRQDAQESINSQPAFKPKPVKPNYLSAVVWTSVVAAIVCTIFMGILLYLLNASNIESNLEDAANHAVYNLEQIVRQQNSQLQQLKEEQTADRSNQSLVDQAGQLAGTPLMDPEKNPDLAEQAAAAIEQITPPQ